MIVANVSFLLEGGVRLIRSAKKLEKAQIKARLEATKEDDIGCQFCWLPEGTKSHTVDMEVLSCIKELPVTSDQYNAITRSKWDKTKRQWTGPHPSTSALREHDMSPAQWVMAPEYTKLVVYYSDIAHDFGAVDYRVQLFPV